MKDVVVLFRWDDGAFGLTGWGGVLFALTLIYRRPK